MSSTEQEPTLQEALAEIRRLRARLAGCVEALKDAITRMEPDESGLQRAALDAQEGK